KYNLSLEEVKSYYIKILNNFLDCSDSIINHQNILSVQSKNELLISYNQTQSDFPDQVTLTDLFQKQVVNNPEKIAIEYKDRTYTFAKLNALSNQLSRYLDSNYEITKGDLIGINLEKGPWMI